MSNAHSEDRLSSAFAILTRPPVHYLLAVLTALVGLIIRLLLWPVLGSSIPYITFFPAVAVSAWVGGLRPGLVCTLLSSTASLYILNTSSEAPDNRQLGDALGLLLFMGVGSFITWLTELQMTARRLAEQRLQMFEQEVEERTRAQEIAAEANRKLSAIINASPLAIVAIDPNSHVTLWNPAAERVFGWKQSEVEGRPMPHVPPDKVEDFEQMRARQLTGHSFTEREIERLRKDGSRIRLSISTAPVCDEAGAVLGTVGIYADLTELRQSNEALRTTAAELLKANQELEQFAYIASHDLQEPLRMVTLYTQLLIRRSCSQDADAQDLVTYITSGVDRMRALISGVLAYSHVIHDDENVYSGIADLDAVLLSALGNTQGLVETANTQIDYDPLPQVRGDRQQLTQVFENLLSNAVKFRNRDRSLHIHVSCCRSENEWIISVRDNGIGFQQIYADHIFGLFKRLDKDRFPGMGVGLAICKRIIIRHGGRIWAESELGKGSVFSFTLKALDGWEPGE